MDATSALSVTRRSLAYLALGLGLLVCSVPFAHLAWTLDPWIHTVLESVATLLALAAGALALVRYYTRKCLPYLVLGAAFLGAGLLDSLHGVITAPIWPLGAISSNPDFITWSGMASQLFLSVMMCGRLFASNAEPSNSRGRWTGARTVWLLAVCGILAIVAVFLWVPLPPFLLPNGVIPRPLELVAAVFFGIATIAYLWKGDWKWSGSEHYLILFLITATIAHSVYLPFSSQPLDALRWMAHALKILSYIFVIWGLLHSMLAVYRGADHSIADQKRMNESLAAEIGNHQNAERALQQARKKLEDLVAANTEELAAQDKLAALASKIALVLTQYDGIQETLQRASDILVHSLDAAFVRIWTLNEKQTGLDLKASAGMYTHLDGAHGHVPLGQLKIGRIAQEGKPHLTNSVQEDSWVGDPEWARREGMVAFAGFPLMVEDRVEGVVAAFARRPLPDGALQALGSVAGSLALFIVRKRMEAALLDSEERVRLLLDSTAEAICGVDLTGNCTLANRACLRLLGYRKPEDLFGRNMHALLHHTRIDGRPYPAEECPMQVAFLKGEGSHIDDEVFWRADGTSFPVEYWSYPVVKAGKIVGAVVTFVDISARKQAEEEQSKLASLVENSGDFIALASPDHKLVYLNGGGARMIGLDHPRQLLGVDILTLHPESAWAQIERGLQALMETGSLQQETELRHWKTGELIDVLLSAFLLRSPHTGEVTCLAAIMRDISGRKRAEQALRTSEERFRIAAENAGDATFEWDLVTGSVDLFGRFTDRFGDSTVPRTFEAWKKAVHPDDLEPVLEGIRRSIESGERYFGEYRVLGANGDVYDYSLRGQAIPDAAGNPGKWIGVGTDITENKRAKESIAQLAAIVQSSEDAIVGASLSGTISTWNGGAEKLLGYSREEALGAPLIMVLPHAGHVADILERSGQGEVTRFNHTNLLSKSQVEVAVSLTVSPIRNAAAVITGVAAIARDITAQVRAETKLAHQAGHDHLTGLPNRLLLADRLEASILQAARTGLMTAVIYLDLDGFKLINETLGHEAGDGLLQKVTDRLSRCIRPPDTLARMGSDEFMLLINDVRSDKSALMVAERLAASLRTPLSIAGHELYVTSSIGISIYPRDGDDVSNLRRNADAAMQQAKQAGKDRILFYTSSMRADFMERFELEADLRQALDRGELFLQYQPIFEAAGCRQTAFEALVRWSHPSRGVLSPIKFVPLAEETGLIVRLGAWVLKEACRECHRWQQRGLDSVRVAANVSPLEFAKPGFVEGVLRVLDETGLRGDLLELELTESMLMRDLDDSSLKMSRLHKHGVRISIDDFGTGYSSLGYLPRLPIDTLKIDRSFVAELGLNKTALSLIEGMISLAHSIGKRVIVEGVETEWQLATLRKLGCDEVQGFLLGRPGHASRFRRA